MTEVREVEKANDAAITGGTKAHEEAKSSYTTIGYWVFGSIGALLLFAMIWYKFLTADFGAEEEGLTPAQWVAILLILSIAAWAITKGWKAWVKGLAGILAVILLLDLIGPGFNRIVGPAVHWFNYGNTKKLIQRAHNAHFIIRPGDQERILASGTITLENKGWYQCIFIEPETPYKAKRFVDGYTLLEVGSGAEILTTTWTSNASNYTVTIADGRIEKLTIQARKAGEEKEGEKKCRA